MTETIECIEFTIDELQALQEANHLASVLKICFLYGSDQAFHALCAIVEYGKDLSATSKRIKRDARMDLYKKIVAIQHPHAHDVAHRSLTYQEFASALTTFSDRWSNQYPPDEVLSLAFIVDQEELGYIDMEVFVKFIESVDKAFHSDISYPDEALNRFYDSRREALYKHVMHAFHSVDLRNKLAYLASLACQFHVQPLTALFELLDSSPALPTNEELIGFLVQLAGTVNHGIKQLEAAQLMQEHSVLSPRSTGFSTPGGSVKGGSISPIGSVASSSNNGHERHITTTNSGDQADHSFAAQEPSYTSRIFSLGMGDGIAQTISSAEASAQPSARDSPPATPSVPPSTQPRTEATNDTAGTDNIAAEAAVSGADAGSVTVPPASAAAILETVQAFQTKAQQLAEALSAPPTPAAAAVSEPPKPSENRPTSPSTADAAANETATISSASSAQVSTSVLPHILLQQLQQMEAQLNKAKQLVLPIVGASAALGPETVTPDMRPRLSRRPSAASLSSPTPGGSVRKLSLASPMATTGGSVLSPTPGSARRRSSSVRRGSLLDTSLSLSSREHNPSSGVTLNAKQFMEMNLSHSRTIGETGKLDRSSLLVRNVDLSIFKSPLNHKKAEPRNVFDNAKQTWTTAPHNSSVASSSKRRERFQTTKDLAVAREVNPVFYCTDF